MRTRVWPLCCAVLIGLFLADLLLQPGGTHLTRTIDDVAEMLAAAAAATAGVWRARHSLGRTRGSWYLIAGGCAGWAVGEAIWCYYELLRGVDTPFPSPADAGFLIFPVLALAGLLLRPSAAFTGQGRIRVALDAVLVASSLFIISWVTALGQVYQQGGDSTFAAVVSIAYPASDLILLTVAVVVVSYARSGDRAGLLYSAVGFVALCVGDSGFAYLTAMDKYGEVNLIDSGWVAGFLIIAVAAILDRSSNSSHQLTVPPRTALLLPYVPAAAAVGVALHENTSGGGLSTTITVAATALVTSLIARQMLVLVDNRRLMDRISHQAFHDALTGLANRALFGDRLSHALDLHRRDLRPVTVLLIDLDDFKMVNDTLGHPVGDELLVRVSERLRAVIRTGDTVARLGGDEFAILMEDGGDAIELASRVLASLEQVVVLGSRSIAIGASIGIATLHPEDVGATSTDMLKRADVAMYAAKRAGKSTVCAYTGDLEDTDQAQLDLRAAFARDLDAGALDVAFQPIHLADGRLGGFEALARWTHEGSAVSPATFLPMARRLDVIGTLDELVLRRATAEAMRWGPSHVISVNVDGATLAQQDFPSKVASALSAVGLPSARLAIEVLETSLIEHDEPALASLERLRELGVRVVVDDFGAGYASLVRLQALNPDVVKIDRSLVAAEPVIDGATSPLLSGVAELAHRMGAFVVAEGVETEDQLSAAIAAGCDAVQGFLLGRPAPAAACAELARQDVAEEAVAG